MNYSKGEWSILEVKSGRLHIIRTLPNGGVDRICEIAIPSTGYRVDAEANAHIMAAAPEMYEACHQANWLLGFLSEKDWNEEIIKTRAQLRQALAKVETK